MARRKRGAWADFIAPEPMAEAPEDPESAPAPSPADKPEPPPWTHLEPSFPTWGTPFTPTTLCRHLCQLCRGAGSFLHYESNTTIECPECGGTGCGPERIPEGSARVCMICHQAGKDGTPALPLDVEPLPPEGGLPLATPPAEPEPEPMSRKERRKLLAWIEQQRAIIEARNPSEGVHVPA